MSAAKKNPLSYANCYHTRRGTSIMGLPRWGSCNPIRALVRFGYVEKRPSVVEFKNYIHRQLPILLLDTVGQTPFLRYVLPKCRGLCRKGKRCIVSKMIIAKVHIQTF